MPRIIEGFFGHGLARSRDAATLPLREWMDDCPKTELSAVREWLDAEISEAKVHAHLEQQRTNRRMKGMQPSISGDEKMPTLDQGLPGDGLRADRLEYALLHLIQRNRPGSIHQVLGPNVPRSERARNAMRAAVVCACIVDPDAETWLGSVTPLASAPWKSDMSVNPPVKGRADVVVKWRDEALRLLHEACCVLGCQPMHRIVEELVAAMGGPQLARQPAGATARARPAGEEKPADDARSRTATTTGRAYPTSCADEAKARGGNRTAADVAKARAETYIRNHPYPGRNELARRCGCHPSVMTKAINSSEALKKAKAHYELQCAKPAKQSRPGDDPAWQAQVDEALRILIENASESKRAELNTPEMRKHLAQMEPDELVALVQDAQQQRESTGEQRARARPPA